MRHEECFALQADGADMMSVARRAFLANVDDIYELADGYAGKHGFFVSVRYSSSRGYYLAFPEGTALPQDFIHPSKSGRFVTCTTEEILSLNNRAQDSVHDLLLMTGSRIQEVLDVARSHYDALASLSDAIAILDFCHSNADCVTSRGARPWCRPTLTCASEQADDDEAAMVIENGRYVIEVPNCLTANGGIQDFVANDTYTTKAKPFTVITGINGSGKSTYLKQIGIICILAHCGLYVPAESASIPIRDRLCTRIGNTDDPEHNISTFMNEMKETAFICRNVTSKSLLLLDELGRATSNEDGVALAWAVSERLLQSGALTFFVTHYPQVTLLGHKNMYALVQNKHMEATVSINAGQGGDISYTHKVSQGPCRVGTAYGVDLAHACGWPDDVLCDTRTHEARLREVAGEARLVSELLNESNIAGCCKEGENIVSQLKPLLRTKRPIDLSAAKRGLQTIKKAFNAHTSEPRTELMRIIYASEQGPGRGDVSAALGDERVGEREVEAERHNDSSSSSDCDSSSSDDEDSVSGSSTSSSSCSTIPRDTVCETMRAT